MVRSLLVVLLVICISSQVLCFHPRNIRPSLLQKSSLSPLSSSSPAPYETFWFNQTLDHFNFFTQPQNYQQRYLVSTTYINNNKNNNNNNNKDDINNKYNKYDNGSCVPMIFYTGNEGDITWFYNNTGFVTDTLASEFGAVVVFAEHRYYGESLPFGDSSFTQENVAYLTTEQALADYAQIIPFLKSKYNVWGCPVIATGGSYGGMLAAWFRMSYPHVVDAALAASAPILQFEGTGVTEEIYNTIITNDFAMVNSQCPDAFREGFATIAKTPLTELTSLFKLCTPLDDVNDLVNWLVSGIGYMAMADYPYPASFLEPMPAWPVTLSCEKLMNTSGTILERVYEAISVYYNYTGVNTCYNTSVFMTSSANNVAWDYQACTEMVFPISSNGVDDMFPPSSFDIESLNEYCQETWGVTPRPQWIPTLFGGQNISSSNIIFSNGFLDPWSGGGVTKSKSDTLVAIVIEQGAHHLDLRTPNPQDPPSVIEAREYEIALLKKWLQL